MSTLILTKDNSLIVGTTAVWAWQNKLNISGLTFMRITNNAAAGGGTIHLSRNGAGAVVNGSGSFPLPPGAFEQFTFPQSIPLNPLSLVSTAANTPVTIEFG
jgi:hypothetical protein